MKKQTAVQWLAEKMLHSEFDNPYVQQALQMEREQHGNTWDAAIKAHDDRGHVHARSLTDFDEYEVAQ
jgi:hypothetical protein